MTLGLPILLLFSALPCLIFFRSYALEKRMQYILPLGDSTASMAIDATLMGNVARFLNHSCAPNVYKVACVTAVVVLKTNTMLAWIFGSQRIHLLWLRLWQRWCARMSVSSLPSHLFHTSVVSSCLIFHSAGGGVWRSC